MSVPRTAAVCKAQAASHMPRASNRARVKFKASDGGNDRRRVRMQYARRGQGLPAICEVNGSTG